MTEQEPKPEKNNLARTLAFSVGALLFLMGVAECGDQQSWWDAGMTHSVNTVYDGIDATTQSVATGSPIAPMR